MPIVWIYKIMVMAKGKGWRPKQRSNSMFDIKWYFSDEGRFYTRENKDRLIIYLLLNCFNHTIMTIYLSIGLLSLFA